MTPQEAEKRRCVIAYGIAKEICEKTQTYKEALYMTEKVADMAKGIIERDMKQTGAYTTEEIRDRWGNLIEVPQEDAQGIEV